MAKKLCKCAVCGVQFDRNSEQAVRYNARRYAHQNCYPEGELVPMETSIPQDPDLVKLKDYINQVYGKEANWAMIQKQIKKYNEEGYSYGVIFKTLYWWYDIKKNSIKKSNGSIGIFPYIYSNAREYYYRLYLSNLANKNKKPKQEKVLVNIKPPVVESKKMKLFWEDDDDE